MARVLAPEGHYYGKIIKQDVYSTKEEGGTPYLGFDVLLTGRDDEFGKKQDLEVPLKRQFSLWINSPENVKRTEASLNFLGFEGDDISRVNPYSEDHHSFVGKEVSLDISHKPDNKDELQESIWLSKAKKPLDQQASAGVLAGVAEMFKQLRLDRQEKKVAKMSDEDVAQELAKAEARKVADEANQARVAAGIPEEAPPF